MSGKYRNKLQYLLSKSTFTEIVLNSLSMQLGCFPANDGRFSRQTPMVATQLAGRPNHPVARNKEGHRIIAYSCANCPAGIGRIYFLRKAAISLQSAKWYFKQRFPNL